jgi:hypothetical protein
LQRSIILPGNGYEPGVARRFSARFSLLKIKFPARHFLLGSSVRICGNIGIHPATRQILFYQADTFPRFVLKRRCYIRSSDERNNIVPGAGCG